MILTHRSAASRVRRDPERLRGHRFPSSFHPLARHRSRICWSVISFFFLLENDLFSVSLRNTSNALKYQVLGRGSWDSALPSSL